MSTFLGWFGELKTTFYIWLYLPRKRYHRFHNIILPSNNGTTQIDHLIISTFGLFIVETKNRKGWIFGSENQANWTQSIFGKNYSFQNPLRQTFRQKKILSEFLTISDFKIHTIIYFVGDCEFKSLLPQNVITGGLSRYIKQFRDQKLTLEEVDSIIHQIEHQLSHFKITKNTHLKSLKQRHSSNTICPRCGSKLVERTARRGTQVGTHFLGCTNYPKCRFTNRK